MVKFLPIFTRVGKIDRVLESISETNFSTSVGTPTPEFGAKKTYYVARFLSKIKEIGWRSLALPLPIRQ